MTLLILGLIVWWIAHLIPVFAPAFRARLSESMGVGPSKGVAALVLIGSVALMVVGYQQAAFVEVWTPPTFLWHLNSLLMLLAVFLFIAGNMPSPVRRKVRHPQLTGTKTWAVAHLLVNGDLASVVLFGGLLAWAVVSVIGLNRRDGPRGELPASQPLGLVFHLGLTAVVFAVIAYVHGAVLGVWPFPV